MQSTFLPYCDCCWQFLCTWTRDNKKQLSISVTMGFFQNKMSRNGNVRDALTRLREKHNAIIDRRRKDRENAAAAKKAEADNTTATAFKASALARSSGPASKFGRNSVAELDSTLKSAASSSPPSSTIGRNSVAELDSVCPKSPTKNSTSMPSVAEWLLWGDDESLAQHKGNKTAKTTTKARTKAATPPPPQPKPTRRSRSAAIPKQEAPVAASPSRSPFRAAASPKLQQQQQQAAAVNTPTISESHSFDNSQLDSHFYSEFTGDDEYTVDYTVDDSLADVTLASSKEPGLFAHGLMAVGELFIGSSTQAPAPVTPSPERRRRPRRVRRITDREYDSDDESTQAYSTYAKDDAVLAGTKFPLDRGQSATTATTASSSPSALLDETNEPLPHLWHTRRTVPVKNHTLTNVNVIESSEMEFEVSLETVTRIEI